MTYDEFTFLIILRFMLYLVFAMIMPDIRSNEFPSG